MTYLVSHTVGPMEPSTLAHICMSCDVDVSVITVVHACGMWHMYSPAIFYQALSIHSIEVHQSFDM